MQAVVDADEGHLILRPEPEVRDAYPAGVEDAAKYAELARWRDKPAVTADGVALKLMLNIGLALELPQLERTGADGIGLFRTEIAMLARGLITDVAEQARSMPVSWMTAGDRPVMFRTLDLGADKLLPGTLTEEENPAMGWRSLRVGLDRPALLRRQLRALLLAAGDRALSVMFPMVATAAEFRAAKALLLAEAKRVRPSPAGCALARCWKFRRYVAVAGIAEGCRFHLGRHERFVAVSVRRRSRNAVPIRPLRFSVAADARYSGTSCRRRRRGRRPRFGLRRGGLAST